MKKKIFGILLIISIFNASLYAVEESKIKETMSNKIDSILNLISNKSLDRDIIAKKTFLHLDEIFDYKIMSRISLGKKYKKLDKPLRDEFSLKFEKKLKLSYLDKLKLYTDEKVKIKELKKVKKNRILLNTDLIGKSKTFKIVYKFYKNKNNEWLIYDVEIEGVSIIQTFKKQFSSYLSNNSIEDLIKTL